jgi:ParB family transcriptional regulator, chromosome partitioning protein
MGKKSLGRGLDAIFKDHSADEPENESGEGIRLQRISLDDIDPNPYQPRRVFSAEEIEELAETIREHGIIQPVTVRKSGGRFQIVSGERRTRAARVAGLTEIDARVFELLSDKTMAEWALIENIQRVDLNPIEIAISYQQLLDQHGYTHEDLSSRVGKSRTAITNSLRLLRLPENVKTWIEEGKISAGAARSLLSPTISDPEKAALEIIEKGLSVRDAENLAKKEKIKATSSAPAPLDPDMQLFLREVQQVLGTRVRLQVSSKDKSKGSLLIDYESLEDLGRIKDIIFQIST